VFAQEKTHHVVPRVPLSALLRRQRRAVALAAGSALGLFSFPNMVNTYLTAYGHTHLGYSRNVVLVVGVLGGLIGIAFVAFSAILSDRVGRRRMMMIGWAACLPWSFVVIPLIDTGKPICYMVATVGMQAIASIGVGPTAAFIHELFPTRYRYSATALVINLASIIGGAAPPLIAGALQAAYGSWAISLMMTTLTAVSLVCAFLLPETSGTALGESRAIDSARS
jgi:MFS family permease